MKEYIVQAIAQETIDSFDAHNATELIRCRDCKHRSKEMYDYYCNPNNKVYVCQIHDLAKNPDWFCADGEREEMMK